MQQTRGDGLPPLHQRHHLLLRGPQPDPRADQGYGERTATQSAIFAATGTFYNLKLSVNASGIFSATFGTTVVVTFTPAALASGSAAVATTRMTASFDNVVFSQP